MLRLTVEIIPFGDEDHFNRRTVGVIDVGNITKVIQENSTYAVNVTRDAGVDIPNFKLKHNRSEGAYVLLSHIIDWINTYDREKNNAT